MTNALRCSRCVSITLGDQGKRMADPNYDVVFPGILAMLAKGLSPRSMTWIETARLLLVNQAFDR